MLQHWAYDVHAAPPARQSAPFALFDLAVSFVASLSVPLAHPANTPAATVRIARRTAPSSETIGGLRMGVTDPWCECRSSTIGPARNPAGRAETRQPWSGFIRDGNVPSRPVFRLTSAGSKGGSRRPIHLDRARPSRRLAEASLRGWLRGLSGARHGDRGPNREGAACGRRVGDRLGGASVGLRRGWWEGSTRAWRGRHGLDIRRRGHRAATRRRGRHERRSGHQAPCWTLHFRLHIPAAWAFPEGR
jgi:hypothetical protein